MKPSIEKTPSVTMSLNRASVDVVAGRHDFPDKLVADHHRWLDGLLGPMVPVVDVNVSAADGGFFDLDEDVVDSGAGDGHFGELKAGAGPQLGDGTHRLHAEIISSPAVLSRSLRLCPQAS
jgi:hypothetical protein